ncbi:hypothetical protein F5Y19DRAFT_334069 [Xylariaceae sp. FL1651]|nr:hypothetical protein F5Y19DRAFT_334069 [Xylariaceae sp. FL1651]
MEMQPPESRLRPDGTSEHGPARYAKPSEWAQHKDTIRKLYLIENKTLDEVRRIMLDEHQFYATPSMYKKRIRFWHFSKKLEENEVLEVLQQKIEKEAAGENSPTLVIRGRVVRNQRLRRFLERRPDTLARLEVQQAPFSSTNDRSLLVAPPRVPRVRSLSLESRDMEKTLTAVRDYIRECAFGPNASWIWTPEGYTSRRSKVVNLRASKSNMHQAVDEFYLLQAYIDEGKPPSTIFQLLNSTLNRVSGAIKTELPEFFFQMIEVLHHKWSNHPELSRIFRRHVAELAVVHLGKNHPITIFWIHMLKEQDGGSFRTPQGVLEMLLQELAVSLGSQDHLTCTALDYLLRFITYTQGPVVATKRFKDWLLAYPGWDDPERWSGSIKSRLAISKCRMVRSNYHYNGPGPLASAAMTYQKPGANPLSGQDASFFLSYLGGRIALRDGDSQRAEGWLLKAMVVAKQCGKPQKLDYLLKVFTNLQVLYTAIEQKEKLNAVTEELNILKSQLPKDFEWVTHENPNSEDRLIAKLVSQVVSK